jgi:phage shock protein PspC (stress-responsive transcriptional regulator)
MNKTVTINISGIIFHIEEDAYENLGAYLRAIRSYFRATDGGGEIMADIESRIAELLRERISASKQAILMEDVNYVKSIMGRPEDFSEEAGREEAGSGATEDIRREKIRRRLYRNTDEKILGGVCSGLAAYFDIDTVWVRLGMFLLIFFGGLSIWLYIILWIIIPEAKTTAEKFAMRGEPANINNIFKSFKEEAGEVKNRFSKYGDDLRRNYGESVRSNISSVLSTFFNIIGRFIGLVFVILGASLLLAYVASLLGLTLAGTNADVNTWITALTGPGGNYALFVFSMTLVFGIPVLMLLYAGIKMLFRIYYSNRWLNAGMGFLWLCGLIMGVYVTVNTIRQFSEHSVRRETFDLVDKSDTLFIRMNPARITLNNYGFDNADVLERRMENSRKWRFGHRDGKVNILGFAQLDVMESSRDSAELLISYASKGGSRKEALENADAIQYHVQQQNNEIIFDQVFVVEDGVNWRVPEVNMKLMLPVGKVVKFDKSVKYLLDDVANTSNTWDGDMAGRRWKMTEKGLECIDCEGLGRGEQTTEETPTEKTKKHKKRVRINSQGVNVKGRDTEINIDKDGIMIKTPEENIELK